MSFCLSNTVAKKRLSTTTYAKKDNRTVFQLCPVYVPNLQEIEKVLIKTKQKDFKSKSDEFVGINVNYNQVVKWYSFVRLCEDMYEKKDDENKGVFDLIELSPQATSKNVYAADLDDIENCIINTKKDSGNNKIVKFASHNLNFVKVMKWYPTVMYLERCMMNQA